MRRLSSFVFLLYFSTIFNQVLSQSFTAFGTSLCIKECFDVHSDAVFCTHARDYGYCCASDDTTTTQCQEDESKEIYCSKNIIASASYMKYTYCPRKTAQCGTFGPVLRPLLNQNQTVVVHKLMKSDVGDVCYWELKVDAEEFKNSHPAVSLDDLFINLVITGASNVTTYQLQGNERTNATNVTLNGLAGSAYRYPLSKGNSLFLIAYPTDQVNALNTSLNFTFNLTADYYPPQGMTIQLQADILPDIIRDSYWITLGALAGLFLIIMVIVMFYICCKDFDPENDFEKRRKQMAKDKKKRDKQLMKQKAKEEKEARKNAKSKPKDDKETKKKPTRKQSSEEEEESEEEVKPKKGAKNLHKNQKSQDSNQNKKKPVKRSLETEVKLKDEKQQKRDDFKMPFLDDDEED